MLDIKLPDVNDRNAHGYAALNGWYINSKLPDVNDRICSWLRNIIWLGLGYHAK